MCSNSLIVYSSILYLVIILNNVFQLPFTILVFGPKSSILYFSIILYYIGGWSAILYLGIILNNVSQHSYFFLFLESTPVSAVHPGDFSPPHQREHWSVSWTLHLGWLDHCGQHCGWGQDGRGPEGSVEHSPSGVREDQDGIICGQITRGLTPHIQLAANRRCGTNTLADKQWKVQTLGDKLAEFRHVPYLKRPVVVRRGQEES